jgi:hypothetical protein
MSQAAAAHCAQGVSEHMPAIPFDFVNECGCWPRGEGKLIDLKRLLIHM